MTKIAITAANLTTLVAYATTGLGLEVPAKPAPTKASVLALIAATGFDVVAGEIEVSAEEAAGAARAPLTVADAKGRQMVKINIPMQEGVAGGMQDVPVGVNGTVALIRRGVDVDVPVEYVEVLSNAKKTIYDREENGSRICNPREAHIYPFSIIAYLGAAPAAA